MFIPRREMRGKIEFVTYRIATCLELACTAVHQGVRPVNNRRAVCIILYISTLAFALTRITPRYTLITARNIFTLIRVVSKAITK